MAENSIYINDQERIQLFDFLIEKQVKIIPNLHYESDSYISVTDATEFLRIIEENTVRFFLTSNTFSKQDLVMERNEFSEKEIYHIMQRKGGPAIDIGFYRGYDDNALIRQKATNIHFYPKYIDATDYYNEIPASEELKAFYKEIVDFLALLCHKVMVNRKSYLIGKSVLKDVIRCDE